MRRTIAFARIDGMVALIMALGRAIVGQPRPQIFIKEVEI